MHLPQGSIGRAWVTVTPVGAGGDRLKPQLPLYSRGADLAEHLTLPAFPGVLKTPHQICT